MKAILMLEDGTSFMGTSFGAENETFGEIVFNTCMSGYQEILTDPSCHGQIIVMTYPLIGNYGFNESDCESSKPHAQGLIVKELCDTPSNWRCSVTANEYFIKHNITGIKDVDTRSLTQHIRTHGSMYGIISTSCFDANILAQKIQEKIIVKKSLVQEVSTKDIYYLPAGYYRQDLPDNQNPNLVISSNTPKKVTVLDLGVKHSILRSFSKRNCDLSIYPCTATAADILSTNPDGIVISNGPGNPKDIPWVIENVKKLLGHKPIIGLCLGHQLLGLALGGNTYKLKFGHHGGNHPVKDFTTGRVYITTQSHNYALENELNKDVEITQINVSDQTIEAFRHKLYPLISVQYHPEGTSVSRDSSYILDDFITMMEESKNA